jgi:hypothetical protein
MMPYDYSDAPPPREMELIPAGTIATVTMHINAGGVGEDGMCKRSKDGNCELLEIEFVVADGKFARRKFWANMVLAGTTAGHAQAAEISRSTLRGIIESARNVRPDDMSPEARTARTVSLGDFNGLSFVARIGVEKGGAKKDKNGTPTGDYYDDKNTLAAAIPPGHKDWHPVEQTPPFNGGGAQATAPTGAAPANAAPPIARPGWATS